MDNQRIDIFENLHDFDLIDNILNDVLYADNLEEKDKIKFFYYIGKAYFEQHSEYERAHQILLAIPHYFQNEASYLKEYLLMGKITYNAGKYDKGVQNCETALKYIDADVVTDDERAETYLYLGLCAYEIRDLKKAIHYMTLANGHRFEDPEDNYRANFYLAMAHHRANEFYEAIPYYHRATKEAEIMADIIGREYCTLPYYSNHWLARTYDEIEDLENTIKYELLAYKYAVADEFRYFASYNLGDAFLEAEDYKNAIKYYNLAIEYRKSESEFNFKPNNFMRAEVYYSLGKAYIQEEEYKKAIESLNTFKKYVNDKSRLHDYFYTIGEAYFELEDLESAIFSFEKAVDFANDDNERYYGLYELGKTLYENEDYSEAIEALNKSLDYMETDVNKVYSVLYLAKSFYQVDEYETALQLLREICELNVDDWATFETYYEIGSNLYMIDEEEEAINMFEFAKQQTDDQDDIDQANYGIAKCYSSLENFGAVLEILSTLIENSEYNELDYFNYLLAQAFHAFGDKEKAEIFIERALEFGGDEYDYILELKEEIDEM